MSHYKIYIFLVAMFLMSSCVKTDPDIYGNIYGVVSDAESGQAIQGAEVTLSPGGKVVTTGSDGRYEFNRLEAGQYTISVIKSKYQINTKYVTVNPGVTTKTDVTLQTGKGYLTVDSNELDFGLEQTQKVLVVNNKGTNALQWQITTDSEWISDINPREGVLNANASTSIVIKIDRAKLQDEKVVESRLLIVSDSGSEEILVRVNQTQNQTEDISVKDGLVAYYNFEGNFYDLSDYKNNAHAVNNPDFTADTPNLKGKALYLSAAKQQYFVIPANPLAKSDGYTTLYEYTISFWIKGLSSGTIFSLIDVSETLSLPHLYIKDSSFKLGIKGNGTTETIDFGKALNSNQNQQWHMITYTSKQGTQSLYIDSELWAEKKAQYGSYQLTTKSPIHFGGDGGFSNYRTAMSYTLDNVRFHNVAIDRSQIEQIYNAEK